MTVDELDRWLSGFLKIPALQEIDPSQNGLQVARGSPEVGKVAFAVDASLEAFRRAAECGAQLLFVHHGLFWSKPQRLVGNLYARIRFLLEKDIGLYAAHIPLDMHPEVGNNVGIARTLGLGHIEPFGRYNGIAVGCKGVLPEPRSLEEISSLLAGDRGEKIRSLPFGPKVVRTVGIVSGGAPWDVTQAISEGLDLFITGEAAHGIYHHCLESGIHAIFAGHYHSETFGVRLLCERLARETGVHTVYLDIPTGL